MIATGYPAYARPSVALLRPNLRKDKLILSVFGVQGSQQLPTWWSWSGSNRRPPECKSGALPAELQPLNPRDPGRAPAPGKSFAPFPGPGPQPQAPVFNRGQLDAGTRESSPLPLGKPFHTLRVEMRDGLTTRPEGLLVVYGVERLSSTGSRCTLKRLGFQRLHPRSLLERR